MKKENYLWGNWKLSIERKKMVKVGILFQPAWATPFPITFLFPKRWNLVEKGNFLGDFGGFWGVWTFFGSQPPHPPTFGRDVPKKRVHTFMKMYIGQLFPVQDRIRNSWDWVPPQRPLEKIATFTQFILTAHKKILGFYI